MDILFSNKLINKRYKYLYNVLKLRDKTIDINLENNIHLEDNINLVLINSSVITKNTDLYYYFKILDSPHKSLYYNGWNMYSLNNCLNIYAEYYGNKLFDLGSKQIGMGYRLNFTYNLDINKVCITIQGGKNIYDKERNFKALLAYNWDPSNLFSFDYLLSNLDKNNDFWEKWFINDFI